MGANGDVKLPGLVVAMPTRGTINAGVLNATLLACHRMKVIPQIVAGFPRDWNRNSIVHRFLGSPGAEWLWFIDDDTLVPPDALELLIAAALDGGHKAVVGVQPLFLKGALVMNVAYDVPEIGRPVEWGSWFLWDAKKEPHAIACCGLGCALFHRSVFETIGEPWFVEIYGDHLGQHAVTEDIHFCRRLRETGQELWVLPALRCGHLKLVNMAEWVPLSQVNVEPAEPTPAEQAEFDRRQAAEYPPEILAQVPLEHEAAIA